MRFAIKNLKNNDHTICRTNGITINIKANGFIVLDTDNEYEIDYWMNIDKRVLDRCGLAIITNDREIDSLEISDDETVVENVDGVSSSANSITNDDTVNDEKTTSINTGYSEEELSKLAKEDLFNICENFGIKYKKNNSVKTLVKTILESGKL